MAGILVQGCALNRPDSPDHILPHLKPDIWHRTSFLYQRDIISMALRMDDVELLDLAFGFVRGCYNQQIKKEQEAENNGEV